MSLSGLRGLAAWIPTPEQTDVFWGRVPKAGVRENILAMLAQCHHEERTVNTVYIGLSDYAALINEGCGEEHVGYQSIVFYNPHTYSYVAVIGDGSCSEIHCLDIKNFYPIWPPLPIDPEPSPSPPHKPRKTYEPKCDCGSDKAGGIGHSRWCEKYKP